MKTKETLSLEHALYKATMKMGVFGCPEVTIGWYGHERVDYMTYDTKGIFRCYEIKVSKADFRSTAALSFVGHYNYFVITKDLYEKVKNEIPAEIGVYVSGENADMVSCVKRAKKQACIDVELLKNSFIRSQARYVTDAVYSQIPSKIKRAERTVNQLTKDRDQWRSQYWELRRQIEEQYGTRWDKNNQIEEIF